MTDRHQTTNFKEGDAGLMRGGDQYTVLEVWDTPDEKGRTLRVMKEDQFSVCSYMHYADGSLVRGEKNVFDLTTPYTDVCPRCKERYSSK